jgi:acetyl esterase/lipase
VANNLFPTFCRVAVATLALAASLSAANKKAASVAEKWPDHFNIPLWDEGKVPLANGSGPLDKPFLTVFLPPEDKRNGASVIIAPGGSNIMLMYGPEGVEVAERYNEWGAAAFVLTYRLSPKYNAEARAQDGLRAMRIVRARAAEWKLDPTKIGIAGFSAGSEVVRSVLGLATPGDPNAADPIDRVSSRPDYGVFVYSAGRPTKGEDLKTFPPTFLITAAWDRGPANQMTQLFLELNRANAVTELHVYQKGRHGFGAATTSKEFSPWMDQLKHFLEIDGFLPEGK